MQRERPGAGLPLSASFSSQNPPTDNITGGDLGDQKLGADKIVFDKSQKNEGQQTDVSGDAAASSEQMQALWLRRVQTRPADFLKAKFAWQLAGEEGNK